MDARKLRLDYFRIYDIENCDAKGTVSTRGQFDRTAKPGQRGILDFFAVCTSKNREPIFNTNAHLTWYRLSQDATEPTRMVNVSNQFGDARLWTGRVEGLLCPAQKVEKGSEFPTGLDHFKVYRVLDYGKPPEAGVVLRDQFGSEETKVLVPDFFAVPVLKRVGKREFPIINPRPHLVIYRTPPKSFSGKAAAVDQFGKWPVRVVRAVGLAVPSLKLDWK